MPQLSFADGGEVGLCAVLRRHPALELLRGVWPLKFEENMDDVCPTSLLQICQRQARH